MDNMQNLPDSFSDYTTMYMPLHITDPDGEALTVSPGFLEGATIPQQPVWPQYFRAHSLPADWEDGIANGGKLENPFVAHQAPLLYRDSCIFGGVNHDYSIPGCCGGDFGSAVRANRAVSDSFVPVRPMSEPVERHLMPVPWPAEALTLKVPPLKWDEFVVTSPADDCARETGYGLVDEIPNGASATQWFPDRRLFSVAAPSVSRPARFEPYSRLNTQNYGLQGNNNSAEEYYDTKEYDIREYDSGNDGYDKPTGFLPASGIPGYSFAPTAHWAPVQNPPLQLQPSAAASHHSLPRLALGTETADGDYMPLPPPSGPASEAPGEVEDSVDTIKAKDGDDPSNDGGACTGLWDELDWPLN